MEKGPNPIEREDIKRRRAIQWLAAEAIPRSNDPVGQSMLEYIVPEILDGGRLAPTLESSAWLARISGRFFPAPIALRSFQFAMDRQMRHIFPQHYPHSFTRSSQWKWYDPLRQPGFDLFQLEGDMENNLLSSIPNGYEIFNLLAQSFKHRWPDGAIVWDPATSKGDGLLQLAMQDRYPFEPYEVRAAPDRGEAVSYDLPIDEEMGAIVAELCNRPPIINKALGSDIMPEQGLDLIFSHTFPMMESVNDPEAVKLFYDLAKEPAGQEDSAFLLRRNIDATNPDSIAEAANYLPGGKADILLFSAVLFQLQPEERSDFFRNYLPYCSPNALFFVSDFANANRESPAGLNFARSDWWNRLGTFATFVIDPFNLEQPPVEVARFITRRCKSLYFTKAGEKLLRQAV